MSLKDFIRHLTPEFVLEINRKRKKNARNAALRQQKKIGNSFTQKDLEEQLINAGITKGDTVLVHSSLSRIGHLKDLTKNIG